MVWMLYISAVLVLAAYVTPQHSNDRQMLSGRIQAFSRRGSFHAEAIAASDGRGGIAHFP
jgi:hypothetical protein